MERRTLTGAEKKKLNKRLVRQTLRGYKRMNVFTQAAERKWAAQLTPEQARRIFEELCTAWEQTGARAGGDWKALDRLRIREFIQAQQPLVHLARKPGATE